MDDLSKESTEKKLDQTPNAAGPMKKVFGYVGFGVGMVLMFAFVPTSKDATTNAIVGALFGVIGGGVGSWLGGLLDKKGK